jgi:hypothetical protein
MVDALSAVTGIQKAHDLGDPVFVIDSSNLDVLLPQLTLPQYVKDYMSQLIKNLGGKGSRPTQD